MLIYISYFQYQDTCIMSSYKNVRYSNKLSLDDRFGDKLVGDALEHHSVHDWIMLYPIYMYRRIYCSSRYKLKSLELTNDGINLLKMQLELHHPELLYEINYRKSRHNTKSIVGINLKK